MKKRQELKMNKTISSGYVEFPARLVVNYKDKMVGGTKHYELYDDYSKTGVFVN